MGVAEVVDHNVQCGEEGVHIEHKSSVPFPWGSGSKPTLVCGHLPLKLRGITHTKRLTCSSPPLPAIRSGLSVVDRGRVPPGPPQKPPSERIPPDCPTKRRRTKRRRTIGYWRHR